MSIDYRNGVSKYNGLVINEEKTKLLIIKPKRRKTTDQRENQ